jgi:hypothetical protein
MARAPWPLLKGRPTIEITLTLTQSGKKVVCTLLADTGAGTAQDPFELVLDAVDCVLCGGTHSRMVSVGGAYSGIHSVYLLPVEIPLLGFQARVYAVGLPSPSSDFDGIACFPFLNRFTYGNFGNKGEFALET